MQVKPKQKQQFNQVFALRTRKDAGAVSLARRQQALFNLYI
jgi:hypothetical protein